MFGLGQDLGAAPRCLVLTDDFDAPALTEADYERLIAEQIAGDRYDPAVDDPDLATGAMVVVDPDRSEFTAQLIGDAQTAPVTDLLVGQLSALDPTGLDDNQRVGLAAGWNRIGNYAHAMRGQAVAALARDAKPILGVHPLAGAAAEIGAALALGAGAANSLADSSLLLADRLPRTLALAVRGDLGWDKASMLAQRTACLSLGKAREVEDKVLPFAVRRTPAQHADAVRRWVERLDPDGADERRKQAKRDVALIRTHHGDGMGELFARMTSDDLDLVWTAADAHARTAKAAGDPRTLDELRVAALVAWASSYLTHGDPTHCDQHCQPPLPTDTDDGSEDEPDDDNGPNDGPDDNPGPDDHGPDGDGPGPDDRDPDGDGPVQPSSGAELAPADEADLEPAAPAATDLEPAAPSATSGPPRRHGRPVRLGALWDLESLLGLTRRCGELLDSGATLPPTAMTELVDRGLRVRRMLIDPGTGELTDLTPVTWRLRPGDRHPPGHGPPVTLGVLLTEDVHRALITGDTSNLDPAKHHPVEAIRAALDQHPTLQRLVHHPVTAHTLDHHPDAETPTPALAEFVALRDRHPTNPTAGLSAASAGDLDHTHPRGTGGPTTRANLTALTRRWHILKTHGHWTVQKHNRGWTWTSPTGRTYTTQPYDYRYDN